MDTLAIVYRMITYIDNIYPDARMDLALARQISIFSSSTTLTEPSLTLQSPLFRLEQASHSSSLKTKVSTTMMLCSKDPPRCPLQLQTAFPPPEPLLDPPMLEPRRKIEWDINLTDKQLTS